MPDPAHPHAVAQVPGAAEERELRCPTSEWECRVVSRSQAHVGPARPRDPDVRGLHWFRVVFETGSGWCFITAGEAVRLRQLTVGWVERALSSLANQYGTSWLEHTLASSPGLLLHYTDAQEPREGWQGRFSDAAAAATPLKFLRDEGP